MKFGMHAFSGYFGEHGLFQHAFDVWYRSRAPPDSKEVTQEAEHAAGEAENPLQHMLDDYHAFQEPDTPQLQQILDKADHAAEEAAAKSMSKENDVDVFDGNEDALSDEEEPRNVDEQQKTGSDEDKPSDVDEQEKTGPSASEP